MTPEKNLEATFRAGHHAHARQMAVAMLQRNPRNKTALQVLAHIALIIGVTGEALTIATRAIEQDDKDPRTNLLLAEIHGARGHTETALSYCDRVLKTHPKDVSALQIGARLLERAGMPDEAMQLLHPLTTLSPKPHLVSLTLARCWMRTGRHDDALKLLDEALAENTGKTPAALQQQSALKKLKARVLDRTGQYDDAWREAAEANALLQLKYNPQTFTDEVDALINWFTKERLENLAQAKATETRHVFIVGMPRSGTTLVEQILDAHPAATGLGEIKDLDVLARMLPQSLKIKQPLPDIIEHVDANRLNQMVASYERSIQEQGFNSAGLCVNKNLRNVFLLGLIAMLFPSAKVILCSRDLRDVGVSSFMASMNAGLFPHLFNTEHMSQAMRDYQRLIEHWRKVLPLSFLEVSYEELVGDQEAQTRRLLDFCELDWNPACLNFWESERTVMTLSYAQVTRPMYTNSIGRHQHYTDHLGPLLELR